MVDIAKTNNMIDMCTNKLVYICIKVTNLTRTMLCFFNLYKRSHITKLRLVYHNLNNELYRQTKDPNLLTSCPCCKENTLEDEYHFILKCESVHFIRTNYKSPYYYA